MYRILPLLTFFLLPFALGAQTLFTYGPYKVSQDEFMRAYRKNNTGEDNAKAREDYLELYTRFKLKVRDAYDMKLDTIPNQKSDLQGFRHQIEGAYLTDESELRRMTEEAYTRSQKDIRVSHIFIPYRADYSASPGDPTTPSSVDSTNAAAKAKLVKDKLAKGEDFSKLAREYSSDPSVSINGGDLGYITVFVLPYPLENAAYSLKVGESAGPIVTSAGYHFIRKTEERQALGRMNISQILIATPPNAGVDMQEGRKKLADSILLAIRNGASFEDMARQFSDDRSTYQNGGQLGEVSVGQYTPSFENAVFALTQDGQVSPPVPSEYGLHIIRRNSILASEKDREKALAEIRTRLNTESRKDLARTRFEKDLIKVTEMRTLPVNQAALWQVTDSFLLKQKSFSAGKVDARTILLSFSQKNILVSDWLRYIRSMYTNDVQTPKKYPYHMEKFRTFSAVGYYSDHLEDYNPAYKAQLEEFRDGNLLFEVMERKVWNKASSDVSALKKYYGDHKDRYQWGPSADAIMINATDSSLAVSTRADIQADPKKWRQLAEASSGKVMTDSGRFEIGQIRSTDPSLVKAGYISPLIINEIDRTASLAMVLRTYPAPAQRSFDEARGLVINDYQQVLEDKWIEELKKKYPVRLDKMIWQQLNR
jgi:peptidyl-prolyl cis-trans isomerase SurA